MRLDRVEKAQAHVVNEPNDCLGFLPYRAKIQTKREADFNTVRAIPV